MRCWEHLSADHVLLLAPRRVGKTSLMLRLQETAAAHGFEGLWRLWDGFTPEQRPALLRGDCPYGQEALMAECERRGQKYLFRQRQTKRVKELLRALEKEGRWAEAGAGWQSREGKLRLQGWSCERRIVALRRRAGRELDAPAALPERAAEDPGLLVEVAPEPAWEYIVLVTNLDWEPSALGDTYRQRADCENAFDELKNQWGWGGFTSHALAPSRLMANLVALFYNWWNLYLRFYDENHHREAIRSRPMLMAGVGRQVQSGGRRTVKVSVLHEKGDHIAHAVTRTSNELHRIRAITERWTVDQRWTLLLTRLLRRWLGGKWLPGLPDEAQLLLSG